MRLKSKIRISIQKEPKKGKATFQIPSNSNALLQKASITAQSQTNPRQEINQQQNSRSPSLPQPTSLS